MKQYTIEDYDYYMLKGEFLNAYGTGVKSLSEMTNDFFYWAIFSATTVSNPEREKLQKVGFKEKDINFLSHLNNAISRGGIFKKPKLLSGSYNDGGRTVTNKLFNGHLTVSEVSTILYKFK